jgi:hypothetical protein
MKIVLKIGSKTILLGGSEIGTLMSCFEGAVVVNKGYSDDKWQILPDRSIDLELVILPDSEFEQKKPEIEEKEE